MMNEDKNAIAEKQKLKCYVIDPQFFPDFSVVFRGEHHKPDPRKEDGHMDHETFHSQMMYSVTMAIVRKSLKEGVITQEEYDAADRLMREKYTPVMT